jgi:hypothetical protein
MYDQRTILTISRKIPDISELPIAIPMHMKVPDIA